MAQIEARRNQNPITNALGKDVFPLIGSLEDRANIFEKITLEFLAREDIVPDQVLTSVLLQKCLIQEYGVDAVKVVFTKLKIPIVQFPD